MLYGICRHHAFYAIGNTTGFRERNMYPTRRIAMSVQASKEVGLGRKIKNCKGNLCLGSHFTLLYHLDALRKGAGKPC